MTDPIFLWRIEAQVPAGAREAAEEVLESRCIAVASFEVADSETWSVEGFSAAEPDRDGIRKGLAKALQAAGFGAPDKITYDLVPPRDWLAENLTAFPPVHVGRYFIHGSQYGATAPAGSVAIQLDPGTAFGSGEHASTAGCLEALDRLARRRRVRRPLDMGCGSGVLAIAMAKTWRVPVIASDYDPEAARVAAENARQNGVGRLIRTVAAHGYTSPVTRAGAPYDLIVANILARPLIDMAGALSSHLRAARRGGGTAILSGLLERDGNWVAAAHRVHGFRLEERITRDGWLTLVMSR